MSSELSSAKRASLTAWRNRVPSGVHSSIELPPSAQGMRPICSPGWSWHHRAANEPAGPTPAMDRSKWIGSVMSCQRPLRSMNAFSLQMVGTSSK